MNKVIQAKPLSEKVRKGKGGLFAASPQGDIEKDKIPFEINEDIQANLLTERVQREWEELFSAPPQIDTEKIKISLEVYQDTKIHLDHHSQRR